MLYERGRATQTQHITRRQRPVRAEAHTARAAHSGGATRQHALLELQDALVDVKGVRHHDRMRDALPMELSVRARALGVLGARILLDLTAVMHYVFSCQVNAECELKRGEADGPSTSTKPSC